MNAINNVLAYILSFKEHYTNLSDIMDNMSGSFYCSTNMLKEDNKWSIVFFDYNTKTKYDIGKIYNNFENAFNQARFLNDKLNEKGKYIEHIFKDYTTKSNSNE